MLLDLFAWCNAGLYSVPYYFPLLSSFSLALYPATGCRRPLCPGPFYQHQSGLAPFRLDRVFRLPCWPTLWSRPTASLVSCLQVDLFPTHLSLLMSTTGATCALSVDSDNHGAIWQNLHIFIVLRIYVFVENDTAYFVEGKYNVTMTSGLLFFG